MNIEQLRDFCIHKKGVTEHFPFDEDTLVFKVMGKMFVLTSLQKWERGEGAVNLKCNPEYSVELREEYEGVIAGFHMSKKHWNTIAVDGSISDNLIKGWIKDSYCLVVSKMTKKKQAEIG